MAHDAYIRCLLISVRPFFPLPFSKARVPTRAGEPTSGSSSRGAAPSILPRFRLKESSPAVNQRPRRFAYPAVIHHRQRRREKLARVPPPPPPPSRFRSFRDNGRTDAGDGDSLITNVVRPALLRLVRARVRSSSIYACINYTTVRYSIWSVQEFWRTKGISSKETELSVPLLVGLELVPTVFASALESNNKWDSF